jgi:hypothetical protein
LPFSTFANAQVEFTLVFEDPYEHFYISPYEFVCDGDTTLKIENSTVFNLKKMQLSIMTVFCRQTFYI